MSRNAWIRQIHRWMAMIFTLVVAGIFVTQGLGVEPAQWIYFLPLLPLAFLFLSGAYLFVLPYALRRRARPGS